MNKQPIVSVITGAYNAEKFLQKSAESVLCQTFRDFEFLICDDGSSDGTAVAIDELARADGRIRLLRHEKNQGLAAALNTCLSEAKGEIIVRHDADDISHPERIEKLLDFLNVSGADFAGSGVNLFDENGVWGKRVFPEEVTPRILGKYNAFMHSAMIFKKAAIDGVGGYRDFYRCEDYDLAARLVGAGKSGKNTQEILVDYFEDKNSYKKHSVRSRLSEFKLRMRLVKILRLPLRYYFYALKPLLLIFVPRFIYKRMHNKKWETK